MDSICTMHRDIKNNSVVCPESTFVAVLRSRCTQPLLNKSEFAWSLCKYKQCFLWGRNQLILLFTLTKPVHFSGLQAGRPRNQGSVPGKGRRFFSSLEHPDRLWGLPNILYSGYRGAAPSRRIKWPKHEAINDLQSSPVVKNVWSLPPFPFHPYVSLLTVHRGCVVRCISRILTILGERVLFKADYSFFRTSKMSAQSQAWVVIRQNYILCGIIRSK